MPQETPPSSSPRRLPLLVGAGLAAGVALAFAILLPSSAVRRALGVGPSAETSAVEPAMPSATSDVQRAQALRAEAHKACRTSRWRMCLHALSQARELDPAGDADPNVQADRNLAVEGLSGPALNPWEDAGGPPGQGSPPP